MTMVGDQDLPMLLNHPGLMVWNMGQSDQSGELSRGIPHQGEEISTYMEAFSQPPLSFPSAHMAGHFDLSDAYHPPKVEPLTGPEYEYYSPSPVGPTGPYHGSSGGPSFVSPFQSTDVFGNHSSGGGGAVDEIDGLSDVSQRQQQGLGTFHSGFPRPIYGSSGSGQSSSLRSLSHVSGLSGVSVASHQHGRHPWMSEPELLETPDTSQALGAETAAYDLGPDVTRMGSSFFEDVTRTELGVPSSNWPVRLKPSWSAASPLQYQPMMQKPTQQQPQQQQQHSKHGLNESGLGSSAFCSSEPNPLQHPVSGLGSANSSVPMQHLHIPGLPVSNASLNPLAEHIVAPNIVPATGLELVHLLLACAEAFANNKLNEAEVILARLRSLVLPGGNPMQRLVAYFEQALTARLTKENFSPIYKGFTGDKSLPQAELLEAFSVYYECIPIGKFGHLTCNEILLDAVEREKAIHVLDLHIWHGMQWPAFLQALALRPEGPPKLLRISGIGSDASDLKETGEKLREYAETLKVPFEYCPILTTLDAFSSDMVETRRGETLVINSFVQFHRILNKSPNALGKLLSDLRLLSPKVLAFAENDGNHNSQSFLTRFVECLRYYSAVFDAFDASSFPLDLSARMKMEQIFAGQKIRNIIACEGPDRVDGHETMKSWHKRLEGAQFRCVSLSNRAVSQANLLLNVYYSSGRYTLNTSDCGYLALGWHGMPLTGVSAWC